jgi:Zn-dependent protease with chaperone function
MESPAASGTGSISERFLGVRFLGARADYWRLLTRGAVVVAAKTVLRSTYSRRQEAAADAYGAELMNKAGGDARALGTMLAKIGGATEPGMTILRDHPETRQRIVAIDRIAREGPHRRFLNAAEWAALRHICTR